VIGGLLTNIRDLLAGGSGGYSPVVSGSGFLGNWATSSFRYATYNV
jgi:hypothetical protein